MVGSSSIRIRSGQGGEFGCYLALPRAMQRVPAIVLASAIYGVDHDLRTIADEFASRGYVAAAPDLFWRTIPGDLPHGDERALPRSQPREEKIRTGERDLADVRSALDKEAQFNGRAVVMGFCYGGPYAIIGPRRLGYDAGIACHGTHMLHYITDLEALDQPLHVLWGDQDRMAPAHVLDAYRSAQARRPNVKLHVFPGVEHGYMMRGSTAFDPRAYEASMACALTICDALSGGPRATLQRS
jgi:carboxymethylenebutenolidase